MLRSLCLKLSVVCVAIAGLVGTASAQPAGAYQNSFSDERLDQMFRQVDPSVKINYEADGSRTYAFRVHRNNGVELLLSVNVAGGKVAVGAVVSDLIPTSLSVEELNGFMVETNLRVAPVVVMASKLPNGQAYFMAMTVINRSVTDQEFATQWNGFLALATELRQQGTVK
jgi:hypothetical protein